MRHLTLWLRCLLRARKTSIQLGKLLLWLPLLLLTEGSSILIQYFRGTLMHGCAVNELCCFNHRDVRFCAAL